MGYTGFHAAMPTPIEQEISLAESLVIACMMRYGDRDYRILRTDPAKVFSMMCYARLPIRCADDDGPRYEVWQRSFTPRKMIAKKMGHRRPTNDEILTPSHARWAEFRERLAAELLRPDFDFWYAPQRFPTPVGVTSDFWPLCSAQLVGELGCAIAETLALFAVFHGRSDRQIHDFIEGLWHRTTPHRGRRVFDSVDASNDTGETAGR